MGLSAIDLPAALSSAKALPAIVLSDVALSDMALSAIELSCFADLAIVVTEGAGGSAGGSGIRFGADDVTDFGGSARVRERIGGGEGTGGGLEADVPAGSLSAIAVSDIGFAG